VIVEVGGGVRSYDLGDRPVLDGYGLEERCPGAAGAVLVPWPNRVRGGCWTYEGATQQLELSEPAAGNAIHGLARWVAWRLRRIDEAAATASLRIHPQPGWPVTMDVAVEWRLGPRGLDATVIAVNAGDRRVPFGCGFHPYVAVEGGAGAATITVPARRRLVLEAQLPTGATEPFAPVATPFALGDRAFDDCFDDLVRGADGIVRATATGQGGRGATVWGDGAITHLMVFTGDTQPPARRRRSVALEPMTCPPDALNSGAGLLWLDPGEVATVRWGVSPIR
jgi:aldose 1-epimerase